MDKIAEIKQAVRDVLGDIPSKMFLERVDNAIDEGAKDMALLTQACTKVEKMVNLFIGVDKARAVAGRFKEILGRAA